MTEQVYNAIKDSIKNKDIDAENIVVIVTNLISLVEKIIVGPNRGAEKKRVVIKVLEMLIHDSKMDPQMKATINLLVHTTVPPLIDTMIDIGRGNIDIGKHPVVKRCCF